MTESWGMTNTCQSTHTKWKIQELLSKGFFRQSYNFNRHQTKTVTNQVAHEKFGIGQYETFNFYWK